MSTIKEKVDEMKLAIDHLNHQITDFIQHDLLDNVADLLTKRHQFISDLIELLQSGHLQEHEAKSYLAALKQDNQALEHALNKERDNANQYLQNCRSIKSYLDV